jgi:hypothetical protein
MTADARKSLSLSIILQIIGDAGITTPSATPGKPGMATAGERVTPLTGA